MKKRDGRVVKYDASKIESAIRKALGASGEDAVPATLAAQVEYRLKAAIGDTFSVEAIQDIVEKVLMGSGLHKTARLYVLYREQHAKMRKLEDVKSVQSQVADYIGVAKYARHLERFGRRETYLETSHRSRDMLLKLNPKHAELINQVWQYVDQKVVLPSMRLMQFAGKAIEVNHTRAYNCSFSPANRPRFFGELFHILLSGCGAGFSVQFEDVDMLPEIKTIDEAKVRHVIVEDTIEGWARAVNELALSYFVTGELVEFAYHKIRSRGSRLQTCGGRAPGHVPLREALELMRGLLHVAQGRQLRPVEILDICCVLAEGVLSGGIRRSSMICLFSPEDSEMMHAKTGDYPQWRRMANISALYLRDTEDRRIFDRSFRSTKERGEPGSMFAKSRRHGCNPCGEIGLFPWLMLEEFATLADKANHFDLEPRERRRFDILSAYHRIHTGDADINYRNEFIRNEICDSSWTQTDRELVLAADPRTLLSGWQFCNLCEVNCAACPDRDTFLKACHAASVIGTFQASLTRFPFLGKVTEAIVRRDALLGVGLTGIMDNPKVFEWMEEGAKKVRATNAALAPELGIAVAPRTTTIKPSGTASLVLGCVGSGIHPHHDKRYFRRITANKLEAPAQYFAAHNPHAVEPSVFNDRDMVLTFPVVTDGITTKELNGVAFMHKVFEAYERWIKPGSYDSDFTHNVSCTVPVPEGQWDAVRDTLWENRHRVQAMSFLPIDETVYQQAPRQSVRPTDESAWQNLIANWTDVDYTKMVETEDGTSLRGEAACGAGGCEI